MIKNQQVLAALVVLGFCFGGCAKQSGLSHQQAQSENTSIKANYEPFAGTYVGTANVGGSEREISIYLEQVDQLNSDSSRPLQPSTPNLRGQFLECAAAKPCFEINPTDE